MVYCLLEPHLSVCREEEKGEETKQHQRNPGASGLGLLFTLCIYSICAHAELRQLAIIYHAYLQAQ